MARHPCPDCHRSFTRKDALTRHRKGRCLEGCHGYFTVSGTKIQVQRLSTGAWMCPDAGCDVEFKHIRCAARHFINKHADDNGPSSKCFPHAFETLNQSSEEAPGLSNSNSGTALEPTGPAGGFAPSASAENISQLNSPGIPEANPLLAVTISSHERWNNQTQVDTSRPLAKVDARDFDGTVISLALNVENSELR